MTRRFRRPAIAMALLVVIAGCAAPAGPPKKAQPTPSPTLTPSVEPTAATSESPPAQPGSGGMGESVGVQERITITILDPDE